jgi:hypothetical protein
LATDAELATDGKADAATDGETESPTDAELATEGEAERPTSDAKFNGGSAEAGPRNRRAWQPRRVAARTRATPWLPQVPRAVSVENGGQELTYEIGLDLLVAALLERVRPVR